MAKKAYRAKTSDGPERQGGRLPEALPGGLEGARDLDRLIHQPVRLALVSALAVTDRMSFNELKAALELSDGNLSVHARKLEEGGYLRCDKSFEGRMPRTEYSLTDRGRRELEAYLGHMEALIRAVRDG